MMFKKFKNASFTPGESLYCNSSYLKEVRRKYKKGERVRFIKEPLGVVSSCKKIRNKNKWVIKVKTFKPFISSEIPKDIGEFVYKVGIAVSKTEVQFLPGYFFNDDSIDVE